MAWATSTLGHICDESGGQVRTGPFGSQLHEYDYVESGIPVVMPKNIIDGRIDTSDIAMVDEETAERLSQHRMVPGDIVYGRRGDIGRRAYVSENEAGWLCGTGCLRVSPGNKIVDPMFLYYYLGTSTATDWLKGQAIGATLPNLNTTILRNLSVPVPPIAEQLKIADTLSAYDDLIENNTRRIAILEEMAQRLYREWFVHFRYPGHESVPLVESELGLIPEGWEVRRLGDAIELAYGKALKAAQREDGPYLVFGSSGIVGCHMTPLVAGPGVIVGRKGNVGSVYWSYDDFFPIDTVFYVVTELPLRFIYYLLKNQTFINNDSAVPGLNRKYALSKQWIVPPSDLVSTFDSWVAGQLDLRRVLESKKSILTAIRNLALSRMVSGPNQSGVVN